jgi:hypothetical protein
MILIYFDVFHIYYGHEVCMIYIYCFEKINGVTSDAKLM